MDKVKVEDKNIENISRSLVSVSIMKAWTLFINVLIVINDFNTVKSACNVVNNTVTCTFISDLREETLSQIENIGSITRIEVRDNPELFLHHTAFTSTNRLEFLDIGSNNISKIYPDTFKDLPLKDLYLSDNGIKQIFPGTFFNLPYFNRLRLTGNNLKTINKGVFSNLTLKELTLSKNNIASIDNMALENMPNLKKLRLDHNELDTIFVHTLLTYPKRLEVLWLHNNSLTTVTNYMLQKLTNLQLINLGFNRIFFIEPNSFEQTPKLHTLVLTHNHLKEINGDIFPRAGLKYLEKFYLDNNKLMFLSSNFFSRLDNLKRITLVGNPWVCPCLDIVWRLLAENDVVEKCAEDYTSGKRPICVSDSICRYSYNEELREKYEAYKKKHPLYKAPLSCLL